MSGIIPVAALQGVGGGAESGGSVRVPGESVIWFGEFSFGSAGRILNFGARSRELDLVGVRRS